ncbi:MAG: acetyl-CoA carboxylase biotin carboxyl carrier protein [Acidobacteria bacterium]|nr:MAG: acetyl-CoA carboxylase biotin carboxyl carrier protein [Acidobacteriota bacterium]
MSSQDRPETTAAASAPAREPEAQPTEPRASQPTAPTSASSTTNAQSGGRRHPRRHRRSGSSGAGERGERSGGEQRETQARAAQPERDLNLDELRELSELLNEQGFNEFEIEREGFRLRLSRYTPAPSLHEPTSGQTFVPPTVTPVTSPSATDQPTATAPSVETGAPKQTIASADEELHKITSPIVGTFYRSPSPTAESFVRAGSHVEPDTVVCIIEAMKLMNEIQAEVRGTVEKIYVENGQPVEYGQALFGIRK